MAWKIHSFALLHSVVMAGTRPTELTHNDGRWRQGRALHPPALRVWLTEGRLNHGGHAQPRRRTPWLTLYKCRRRHGTLQGRSTWPNARSAPARSTHGDYA